MDFGVFDGLLSSENNNKNDKNTLISSCDLDLKTKWFGSGGRFCKQGTPVSTPANEGEWRNLKMAKISEDEISRRSNAAQNMLSFSSPYTQTLTFPYCARNNNVAGYGGGGGGPFTPSQWMELEHQALIYKYITANAAIPSNLLIPIKKALETSDFSAYSGAQFRHNTFGWGALRLGFCNSSDPEPGRCRRTDGKKWRCAKDAVADQKYCERHMNRGRHRSRKPVEGQTCHSSKLTTSSTVLRHHSQPVTPNPAATSFQDTMRVVNKANLEATIVPMSSPSSVALKKNQLSEFGVVCSDSLLNPMHKSDAESQNPLHQFMEDSNRAQLSISVATSTSTTLLTNHSFLRMGLELELGKTTTNKQHDVSWETSIGGPLGEVLNTSPHGPKADGGVLGTTTIK